MYIYILHGTGKLRAGSEDGNQHCTAGAGMFIHLYMYVYMYVCMHI